MEAEQLKALLARLHAELEDTESVDPELRSLLTEVDRDIHEILEPRADDADTPAPEDSLEERVQAAASSFSVRHPRLESVLREVAEVLSRMGI